MGEEERTNRVLEDESLSYRRLQYKRLPLQIPNRNLIQRRTLSEE